MTKNKNKYRLLNVLTENKRAEYIEYILLKRLIRLVLVSAFFTPRLLRTKNRDRIKWLIWPGRVKIIMLMGNRLSLVFYSTEPNKWRRGIKISVRKIEIAFKRSFSNIMLCTH